MVAPLSQAILPVWSGGFMAQSATEIVPELKDTPGAVSPHPGACPVAVWTQGQ